jgi:hypothetical protein
MMRAVLRSVALVAGIVLALPVPAQLYKWVDQNGVTNYSNERPPDGVATRKLTGLENRVSVYSPDESLVKAVQAMREQRTRAASIPPPPPAPQHAPLPVPPLTPYEQCLVSGRVGCDRLYGEYYAPPWYLPAYYPGRFAPRGRVPPHITPFHPSREASAPPSGRSARPR